MMGASLSRNLIVIMLCLCATLFMPTLVHAESSCTMEAAYQPVDVDGPKGIVNDVMNMVMNETLNLMKNLYTSFVGPGSWYMSAFNAAVIFYFTLYGIMIVFNMASTQPFEIFKRLTKIAIIAMLLNPNPGAFGGWYYFSNYVVQFFWSTMNGLIGIFTNIAIGSNIASTPFTLNAAGYVPPGISMAPFSLLNAAFQTMISVKFFIMLLSLILNGIFGVVLAIMILISCISIMRCIIACTATYFKSMIALSFLLGIAPLFIPMFMFAQTRKIFDGWMSQVVTLTLQPVMMFSFISFFFVLIGTMLMRILGSADYCWAVRDFIQGATLSSAWWTPVTATGPSGLPNLDVGNWMTSSPIDPFDIFTLLILSELAWRYSKYVGEIAVDFGGGGTSMAVTGGDVRQWGRENLVKDNTQAVLNGK